MSEINNDLLRCPDDRLSDQVDKDHAYDSNLMIRQGSCFIMKSSLDLLQADQDDAVGDRHDNRRNIDGDTAEQVEICQADL